MNRTMILAGLIGLLGLVSAIEPPEAFGGWRSGAPGVSARTDQADHGLMATVARRINPFAPGRRPTPIQFRPDVYRQPMAGRTRPTGFWWQRHRCPHCGLTSEQRPIRPKAGWLGRRR